MSKLFLSILAIAGMATTGCESYDDRPPKATFEHCGHFDVRYYDTPCLGDFSFERPTLAQGPDRRPHAPDTSATIGQNSFSSPSCEAGYSGCVRTEVNIDAHLDPSLTGRSLHVFADVMVVGNVQVADGLMEMTIVTGSRITKSQGGAPVIQDKVPHVGDTQRVRACYTAPPGSIFGDSCQYKEYALGDAS